MRAVLTIPLCATRPRRGVTRAAVGVEVAREAMAWHPTAEAVARRTELPQDLCHWLENAATMQLDQQKDQKGGCGSVIRYGSARRTDKTNGRLEEYRD